MPRATDNRDALESLLERGPNRLAHVRFPRRLVPISRRIAKTLAGRCHRAADRIEKGQRIFFSVAFFDETAPPCLSIRKAGR